MSLAEGKALNDSLINVMTGAALPDRESLVSER